MIHGKDIDFPCISSLHHGFKSVIGPKLQRRIIFCQKALYPVFAGYPHGLSGQIRKAVCLDSVSHKQRRLDIHESLAEIQKRVALRGIEYAGNDNIPIGPGPLDAVMPHVGLKPNGNPCFFCPEFPVVDQKPL